MLLISYCCPEPDGVSPRYNRGMYYSPVDGTNAGSLAFRFGYLRGTASSIRRVGELLFVQKEYL